MERAIAEKIEKAKAEALSKGYTLNVNEEAFNDEKHLDCTWHDGNLGSLVKGGDEVEIRVCGEVKLWDHESEISTVNVKAKPFTDEELHKGLDKGRFEFAMNNWIEAFAVKNGELQSDMGSVSSSSNILEGVCDIEGLLIIHSINFGMKEN